MKKMHWLTKSVTMGVAVMALQVGSTAYASGGSGGGGGGGGSTATVLQVSGGWHGSALYDPAVSILRDPTFLDRAVSMTMTEDAAGSLLGVFTITYHSAFYYLNGVTITPPLAGKASASSVSVNIPVSFYGAKEAFRLSPAGTTTCTDGSTGYVLQGTFNSKDMMGSGSGTVSVDNCPVP